MLLNVFFIKSSSQKPKYSKRKYTDRKVIRGAVSKTATIIDLKPQHNFAAVTCQNTKRISTLTASAFFHRER